MTAIQRQVSQRGVRVESLTLEVPIPVEGWIDWITQESEIFKEDYCGQWLRAVAYGPSLGWLVWVDQDGRHRKGEEPEREIALKAWARRGRALPQGWYRLDEEAAVAAYLEGVKRWGLGWFQAPETDGTRYDQAVQVALLGKVVFA